MASSSNVPGSGAQVACVAQRSTYEAAKSMKLATIKRNSPLSDYDGLAEEYTTLVNRLEDPKSCIREGDSAEIAALRRIPGNASNASKRTRALVTRRHKWKVEAFGAFKACIEELQAMKKKTTENKEFQDQVNAIIAKYQKLIEATATKTDKELPAILDSLDTYYKAILLKSGVALEANSNSKLVKAKYEYRKCFERCEQWLEAGKIGPNATEELKKRIREHEEHYKKSVAEKVNKGGNATATLAIVEQAATRPEAIITEDSDEEYEAWRSEFFNDAMYWRDRGFD